MTPKKKSVTMNDVARHAGVSLKTVSNVVNDWPYIREETRERVIQAIEEVGYRRNQNARSLVTGKTKTIGVIVPDVSNPFFGLTIRGCEDRLYEGEYNIFLCNSNEDLEREEFYLDLLMSRGVDGVILWGTRLCCEELTEIIGEDIALVTVDMNEQPKTPNHINIDVDSAGGSILAVQHLVDQGFRNIAHIQGPLGRATSERRLLGYQQALHENGLAFDSAYLFPERPSIRGGFRAASRMLEDSAIDAVFCYNDLMALGAMVAAKKFKRTIPGDIAIVGFDDIAMMSLVSPPLSTIKIDQYALGKLSGDLVLTLLEGQEFSESLQLFPVELCERASSVKQNISDQELENIMDNLITALSDDNPFA